jgi:hypothetical protein
MPEDCTSAEMCFDVFGVRWQEIYDLLIGLSFATWIPHRNESSAKVPMMSRRICGVPLGCCRLCFSDIYRYTIPQISCSIVLCGKSGKKPPSGSTR